VFLNKDNLGSGHQLLDVEERPLGSGLQLLLKLILCESLY
jgi:hypothetical protein